MLARLQKLAEPTGARVEWKSEGHFHIIGALLVNYYPFAARKTAYVAGTKRGDKSVPASEAVAMSQRLPALVSDFKRKSYRAIKLRMLKTHKKCHWCKSPIDEVTATVDHVIPLSRGGIDNGNNRVLACQPCNAKRGNSMPEIQVAL